MSASRSTTRCYCDRVRRVRQVRRVGKVLHAGNLWNLLHAIYRPVQRETAGKIRELLA